MGKECDCCDSWNTKTYRVVDPKTHRDWGIFNYCDKAVEEARRSGFVVTYENAKEDKPSTIRIIKADADGVIRQ